MNPFEFVLGLIALAFLYKLLSNWGRHRRTRDNDEAAAEWQRRLDAVEERVRVLERIVTDERFDLKRQFRDLGS